MSDPNAISAQLTSRNISILFDAPDQDRISLWIRAYLEHGVTSSPASQRVQKRNLAHFLAYFLKETEGDERRRWTPRLSTQFREYLETAADPNGQRRWRARTANTILAHVKTFAAWVTRLCEDGRTPFPPFPAGNPMAGIAALAAGSVLEIERALSSKEVNWILDAADELIHVGGRRKDRRRFGGRKSPQRAAYRPWRNRAIVYFLLGTGCRRGALPTLTLADLDLEARTVRVRRKGGGEYHPSMSKAAVQALRDYLEKERPADAEAWGGSQVLFLPAPRARRQSGGQLSARSINNIWNEAREQAGVSGTPHCARHAVGIKVLEETGKLAAAQAQLGHRNVATTVGYTRARREELAAALDGW